MANTTRVTLSRAYTDAGGRSYEAGDTVALPNSEARNLLYLGLARRPDPLPEPTPESEPQPALPIFEEPQEQGQDTSPRSGAKRVSKRSKNKEGA